MFTLFYYETHKNLTAMILIGVNLFMTE